MTAILRKRRIMKAIIKRKETCSPFAAQTRLTKRRCRESSSGENNPESKTRRPRHSTIFPRKKVEIDIAARNYDSDALVTKQFRMCEDSCQRDGAAWLDDYF